MSTVIVAFGVVFLAEFGDKTEIVTLALVARYGARSVLLGITLATCVISAASVAVGGLLRTTIPARPATIVAGLAFLGFAVWTMRLDDGEVVEPAHRVRSVGGAVAVIGGTFLLTEIGDKTMLATIALASRGGALAVWLGATVGVVAADTIAIVVGKRLRDRLPAHLLRIGSSLAFACVGAALLVEGLLV